MLIMEMVLCSLALIRKTYCVERQQFLTLITHRQCPFVSLNILSTKADTREPGIYFAQSPPGLMSSTFWAPPHPKGGPADLDLEKETNFM